LGCKIRNILLTRQKFNVFNSLKIRAKIIEKMIFGVKKPLKV